MDECIYIDQLTIVKIYCMMPSGVTRTSGILSHSSLVGISSPGWRICPLSASAAVPSGERASGDPNSVSNKTVVLQA